MRSLLFRTPARLAGLVAIVAAYGLAQPETALSQGAASDFQDGRTVEVAVGKAALVTHPTTLRQVSITDPDVAEAVVVSPREVLLHGRSTGTTSLVLWDREGRRQLRAVEVAVDAEALERHLRRLFPGEEVEVTASGNTFILSGEVDQSSVARRAVTIAEATGATVVDNISVPAPQQILLQVRFAEVNRSAIKQLGLNVVRVDPFNVRGDDEGSISTGQQSPFGGQFLDGSGPDETFSDAVNLFLFEDDWKVGAFIRALKGQGLFKSLAEPNLLALDGKEASFLAGGEFPYPVPQGTAAGGQTITIVFKEFGVRLNFLPQITNSGNINLKVAPEVSSLDFASGLSIQGFEIPALRSRRAETEVELRDGQTFAIAGLLDNSITENIDKVPVLGDIPILGALFRSKDLRQNRSELMVLVTPRLVQPSATPPETPTGEPERWDWEPELEGPAGSMGDG
ncbi:MAG: type II and III secretion system protein family protein [Gemmatimonadota bacterium]|nr:type II and III secretion system protein family protein [Gemmatimonadota bacterium]